MSVGKEVIQDGKNKSSFNFGAAIVPAIGLLVIGIVPGYLKDLYSGYADQLMKIYVMSGYAFLASVFGGLAVMMFRDRAALSRSTKTFRFRPDEPASEADSFARVKVSSKADNK